MRNSSPSSAASLLPGTRLTGTAVLPGKTQSLTAERGGSQHPPSWGWEARLSLGCARSSARRLGVSEQQWGWFISKPLHEELREEPRDTAAAQGRAMESSPRRHPEEGAVLCQAEMPSFRHSFVYRAPFTASLPMRLCSRDSGPLTSSRECLLSKSLPWIML